MEENYTNTALLIWQEGDIIKEQWPLEADEILIGRDDSCQIKLPSRWISRTHIKVCKDGNHYIAEDASSKNGLFINGSRIYKPYILNDGDKLQLAPGLDLIFVDSEATAPLPGRQIDLLRLDPVERQVYIRGQLLIPALSTYQYNVLATLAQEANRVYSRYEIVQAAWGAENSDGVTDDAVDAMIRRVRQRLADVDPSHEYILTIRGYGFKLNLEQDKW